MKKLYFVILALSTIVALYNLIYLLNIAFYALVYDYLVIGAAIFSLLFFFGLHYYFFIIKKKKNNILALVALVLLFLPVTIGEVKLYLSHQQYEKEQQAKFAWAEVHCTKVPLLPITDRYQIYRFTCDDGRVFDDQIPKK